MKRFIFCVFIFAGLSACKKASYLTDDGLHVPEVSQNTYDYLASHPNHMFDTLLMVIDHFGLKDEINNAKTFWASSNYSVKRYYQLKVDSVHALDENAGYTFDEFLSSIDPDSVRAYIYNDAQYNLETANTTYNQIGNAGGIEGFAYHKQKQPVGQWSYQDVYYLYYVKIRGEADNIGEDGNILINRNDMADMRILCQTSGIKSSSGTMINVLSNTHTFVHDFSPIKDDGPVITDLDDGIMFTYALSLKATDGYTGTPVVAQTAWIGDTFGLTNDQIADYTNDETIKFYAVLPDGKLTDNYTANGFGQWFDANGNVIAWGNDAKLFSEYNANTFTFNIGQYPGHTAVGDHYTFKQAMTYTNRFNVTKQAVFVFNITIK